ncbi:MAG: DUF3461 family protein [Marinosulfonomonas sp.]|nr:DUF3461 family protein [Marinosulfonomonas sp.]
MKSLTPSLSEMGIRNPEHIIGYSVVHVTESLDVLRINYQRPKNSFLPSRRRYEFKRLGKPMPGSELRGNAAIRYDISPTLARAIAELDTILADEKRMTATKQSLQDELKGLGVELNGRIAHLSKMIDALD